MSVYMYVYVCMRARAWGWGLRKGMKGDLFSSSIPKKDFSNILFM